MIYSSPQDWRDASHKSVLLYGMSGLGKTHLADVLRAGGDWFHYSVDYRIGTRYLGEHIGDNMKREAIKNPFLRDLLLSDSIRLTPKISFHNLTPVASYLGKPGAVGRGGLPMAEYKRRQDQFRSGEIAALNDTGFFIDRAHDIYGYTHFVCDTGGSICEWIDPALGGDDPLIRSLAERCLLVWIKGSEAHTQELVRRFDAAPKPMAYQPAFLDKVWREYLFVNNLEEGDVNPDDFIRATYAKALSHRQPLYAAMAPHGVTVTAEQVAQVKTTADFTDLIAMALEQA